MKSLTMISSLETLFNIFTNYNLACFNFIIDNIIIVQAILKKILIKFKTYNLNITLTITNLLFTNKGIQLII